MIRAVLGAVCGFFTGVFVALDLVLFGVFPFASAWIAILAVAGAVTGGFFGNKAAERV